MGRGEPSLARVFRMGELQRVVFVSMGDGKPRAVADIVAETGMNRAQVYGAIKRLAAAEYVEPAGTGRWQLSVDGRRAIELLLR
jgi:DNA-binding IclR family transcriptional regulator